MAQLVDDPLFGIGGTHHVGYLRRSALVRFTLVPKKNLSTRNFHQQLLAWYAVAGRTLPWRQTTDPYAIVVSEIMLQQTQVSRGLPKYIAWMKRFPDVHSLATAPLAEVLRSWQGLGYNRRAKYLWLLAKTIVTEYGGTFPQTKEEMLQLPGVGPHTAGAIMSFAFGATEPIFDTNAQRVVGRFFKGYQQLASLDDKAWKKLMTATVPRAKDIYNFNQALMDFGALVCTAKKPNCEVCPLKISCLSYPAILSAKAQDLRLTKIVKEKLYYGQPRRIWRGKILRYVQDAAPRTVSLHELGQAVQIDFQSSRLPWLRSVVKLLAKEDLLRLSGNQVSTS